VSVTFFETQDQFRKWLELNHTKETELMVGFYKVGSNKPSMTWSQSVDQALCFGWIDGVRRSIDKDSYCIRFTPRRKTSIWSDINIKKMEELTSNGLMKPPGLVAFSHRKEHLTNIYSYIKKPAVLSPEFLLQFQKNPTAWDYFNAQAPSYKKTMINWIMSAKQQKTRESRLEKTIKVSEEQKRME